MPGLILSQSSTPGLPSMPPQTASNMFSKLFIIFSSIYLYFVYVSMATQLILFLCIPILFLLKALVLIVAKIPAELFYSQPLQTCTRFLILFETHLLARIYYSPRDSSSQTTCHFYPVLLFLFLQP